MGERLKDKVAIVVGAGQVPGETIGNGRATAVLFAREGARVLCVDRNLPSAEETAALIAAEGGTARAFAADATRREDCLAMAEACIAAWGRIDVLHNNVGIGVGDRGLTKIQEADWDRIMGTNLKSVLFACQAVLPHMVAQGSGAIVNISSVAAVASMNLVAYKTSKAGLNSLSQAIAMGAAKKGVRCNVIMPGLMNTPMAIEGYAAELGISREEVIRQRDARVPLKGGMGSAWDVAHCALFLASDEAKFITAAVIPVDGGQSALVG